MTWSKDGVVLETSERWTIETLQQNEIYRTCLVVRDIQLSDDGSYQLRARNDFGEATFVVSLRVKG